MRGDLRTSTFLNQMTKNHCTRDAVHHVENLEIAFPGNGMMIDRSRKLVPHLFIANERINKSLT